MSQTLLHDQSFEIVEPPQAVAIPMVHPQIDQDLTWWIAGGAAGFFVLLALLLMLRPKKRPKKPAPVKQADILPLPKAPEPMPITAMPRPPVVKKPNSKVQSLLDKYDFNLANIESLAPQQIVNAAKEVTAERLALALLGCTPEIADGILNAFELSERELIKNQMAELSEAPVQKVIEAKKDLLARLKKLKPQSS
ncbi:MAG: FliG C-terminal domain-containing protein [Myxococcota bacterium]